MSDIIRRLKCNLPVKSTSGEKKVCRAGLPRRAGAHCPVRGRRNGSLQWGRSRGQGNGGTGRRANFKARHN